MVAAGVGAAWGLALIAQPRRVLRVIDGSVPPGRPLLMGTRVLGARHLGQALGLVLRPDVAARWGAGVDLVHAVSMLGLAAAEPRRRRPELVSAGVSLILGAVAFTGRPR
jgi:hypothetical protein